MLTMSSQLIIVGQPLGRPDGGGCGPGRAGATSESQATGHRCLGPTRRRRRARTAHSVQQRSAEPIFASGAHSRARSAYGGPLCNGRRRRTRRPRPRGHDGRIACSPPGPTRRRPGTGREHGARSQVAGVRAVLSRSARDIDAPYDVVPLAVKTAGLEQAVDDMAAAVGPHSWLWPSS
jgi:hypothetical protein